MKTLLTIPLFFLATVQVFCATVQVDFIAMHKDDLEYSTSIEILDSTGNRIAQNRYQGERLSVDFADSISGKITIRIVSIGYFPIEIVYNRQPQFETNLFSDVLLVPSLRSKLPSYATCGNFAPRKKDIPKKINIQINGAEYQLVPDKNYVMGITYIEKSELLQPAR